MFHRLFVLGKATILNCPVTLFWTARFDFIQVIKCVVCYQPAIILNGFGLMTYWWLWKIPSICEHFTSISE